MTVFITRYLRRVRINLFRVLVLLCLVCAGSLPSQAQTPAPEVTQLRVDRVDDALFLSARLKFELADTIEDALLKGVAMIFVAQTHILRERWYWSNQRISGVERHLRLAYQPLTRRWRLSVGSGPMTGAGAMALNQNFDSLTEALAAMQRFSHWKILETAGIDLDQRYQLEFRFRLDSAQLPRPLQMNAFGQSDWDLDLVVTQPLVWESGK